MVTTLETDSMRVLGTELYHSRLILIGGIGAVYADSALQTWLRLREKRPVKLFVLDVSSDSIFDETLKRTQLPQYLRAEIVAAHATNDAGAYTTLRMMLRECDPSICPNQIILDLPPSDFPRLAAACRELASEWFYGRGPKGQSDWPFSPLAVDAQAGPEVPLADLRACVVNRWFPRRPTAFVVGPRQLRETFAARLTDGEAAFSFVQLADDSPQPDVWCWTRSPDLVFCDDQFAAAAANYRGRWPDAVWVMVGRESEDAARAFGESPSARECARLPLVTVNWSPDSPARVTPRWVTQPLAPSAHNLPAARHYQPDPELEELRRAWRDDSTYLYVLSGESGCGKTSLVRHFLKQCRATAELSEQGEASSGGETPTADAVFVWDFSANPYAEKFLLSFANYISPASISADHSYADCLRRIRDGLRQKNIRRALLVLDGLDVIQHPDSGELNDPFASELLEEIASGRLPLTAVITTRSAPPLPPHLGAGCVSTRLGTLPVEAACELMRVCGLRGDDAQLAALAESFGRHALTISQLGHVLGDCYAGDLSAAYRWLGSGGAGAQAGDGEARDGLTSLIKRYEELLPAPELAILKCLAAAGEPLTASEFAQIFPLAGGVTRHLRPVAGMTPDEVRSGLEVLHSRELVNVHAGHGASPRYAMHPLLSSRFAERLTADAREAISLDLTHYYERQLVNVSASLSGCAGVSPAPMRTRGVTVGPRDIRRNYPTDTTLLDTMEKIIFHTARAGRSQAARLYYEHQMGGEKHLSTIGEDARARRIGGWLERKAQPGN